MGSRENLKRGNPETQFKAGREQSETARKGGVASGVARRQKRDIRKAIEARVYEQYTKANGEKSEGLDDLARVLFEIGTDPNHKQCLVAQRMIYEFLDMDKSADDKKRIKQALKLQEQEIELNEKKKANFDAMNWMGGMQS